MIPGAGEAGEGASVSAVAQDFLRFQGIIWLVVWTIFLFSTIYIYIFNILYGIILPIDFHIFQRGGSTTNQL